MDIKKRLKIYFRSLLCQFGKVNTDKGGLFWDNDQILRVGDLVYKEERDGDGEADYEKAEDGEYKANDGRIIVVEDGVVKEIKEGTQPVADEFKAAATDPADKAADNSDDKGDDKSDDDSRIANVEKRLSEMMKGVEELINKGADYEGRISELEEKVAKLDKEPADDAADEPDDKDDPRMAALAALAARRAAAIKK